MYAQSGLKFRHGTGIFPALRRLLLLHHSMAETAHDKIGQTREPRSLLPLYEVTNATMGAPVSHVISLFSKGSCCETPPWSRHKQRLPFPHKAPTTIYGSTRVHLGGLLPEHERGVTDRSMSDPKATIAPSLHLALMVASPN